MKLLNLLKLAISTKPKATDKRFVLVQELAQASDSSHALARTAGHNKAWSRWTAQDYKELESEYKKALAKTGKAVALLSKAEKRTVVVKVASELGRSPKATIAKLRDTKLVPTHIRFSI